MIVHSLPLHRTNGKLQHMTIPVHLNEPIFATKTMVKRLKADLLTAGLLSTTTGTAVDPQLINDIMKCSKEKTSKSGAAGAISIDEADITTFTNSQLWNDYLVQMNTFNQIVTLATHLKQDIHLTNHKYIAHQIALLFQCLSAANIPQISVPFKKRIEAKFQHIKALLSAPGVNNPVLDAESKKWLEDLTSELISQVTQLPPNAKSKTLGVVSDFLSVANHRRVSS